MTILATPVLASLLGLVAAGVFAGSAQAQSLKQQAVGTWTLVSVKVGDTDAYGPNPHGVMFLDAGGRFSVSIVRAGIPKFASNNRQTGTDAENKAVAQGSIAYFGTYTVDEPNNAIVMRIEHSSFPNFRGAEQRRNFKFDGEQLTIVNTTGASGGSAIAIWKRVQ